MRLPCQIKFYGGKRIVLKVAPSNKILKEITSPSEII